MITEERKVEIYQEELEEYEEQLFRILCREKIAQSSTAFDEMKEDPRVKKNG